MQGSYYSARNKEQKLASRFLKMGYFIGCYIKKVWEIWLIKIDFGQPNAEVVRKMATIISSTATVKEV